MRLFKISCVCSVITVVGLFSTDAFGAPITYRNAVIADNPYAYYRFGELSGTNANDETIGNRDGTYLNGVTLGVASFAGDTAVQFDGADDYVQVPGLADLGTSMDGFSNEWHFPESYS